MSDNDQEVVPLGGLPVTKRVVLKKRQIDVALFEVRFSASDNIITPGQGFEIQGLISDVDVPLPRIQPAQKQQIAVSVNATEPVSQVEVQGRGWQFLTSDDSVIVTVMPDSFAVQTTAYERWSVSILPFLQALVKAIAKVLRPELVYRVGLRYVNRLVDESAKSPTAWLGKINDRLLGAVQDPELGRLLTSTQQQLELKLGDSAGAVLRHGAFIDSASRGATSYLIDTDVFSVEACRFDLDLISKRARTLNVTALALFQQVVTAAYHDEMQPVEI